MVTCLPADFPALGLALVVTDQCNYLAFFLRHSKLYLTNQIGTCFPAVDATCHSLSLSPLLISSSCCFCLLFFGITTPLVLNSRELFTMEEQLMWKCWKFYLANEYCCSITPIHRLKITYLNVANFFATISVSSVGAWRRNSEHYSPVPLPPD